MKDGCLGCWFCQTARLLCIGGMEADRQVEKIAPAYPFHRRGL